MDTSKIIRGVVSNGRYTVTAPIVKEDYGLYLQIEGVELPQTYEVDFSNSEHSGTSVTMIGNADGVLIPHQFISTGKDIFAFLYHVGDNYGKTVYKFRIPNKVRPDRTEEQPTPEEQSVIDQTISALNTAVAKTAQDVESADQSARSASGDADRAESARDTAGEYANDAQSSAESASESARVATEKATASAQSASQSAQIKDDVEDLVDDAQSYAESALIASQASVTARNTAQGYAQSASASANSASGYASQADISANTASTKASEASTSAQTASAKATEASQSAENALSYKTDAESAKTASQTAQGLAESARDSAITAKNDAESAKTDAESARDEAQQAVASISGALDDKAPIITDTASGSIASFSDGADDLPLKSLVVNIDPVQDLHGQENPYPEGGGKNFMTTDGSDLPYSQRGISVTIDSEYVYHVTVSSATGYPFCRACTLHGLKAGTYTLSAQDKSSALVTSNFGVRLVDRSVSPANILAQAVTSTTFTLTEDYVNDVYVEIAFTGSAIADGSYYIKVQLEKGSTPTAWSPYENLCPISGWTEVDVEQRGVNVWDEEWELGRYNITTGKKTSASTAIRCKNHIPVISGAQYYVKTPISAYFVGFDSNGDCIGILYNDSVQTATKNKTMTMPTNCHEVVFYCDDITTYNHDISINYPSTDHDYHSYTGRSITIDLGQTVYGGKLDVLSGVMTVEFADVDLGTLTWTYQTNYHRFNSSGIASRVKIPSSSNVNVGGLCSAYVVRSVSQVILNDNGLGVSTSGTIGIIDTRFTDPTEFKTAVDGVHYVYPLATPIEIQLDAHTINSLYGANNIFADTGDTEVEYRADTKLFIERLTAPDSADMVADANITSGKYFMVGNSLYKATANIANGAQIIVGTNAVRKSLSEALNEINA